MSRKTPRVEGGYLYDSNGTRVAAVASKEWFDWVEIEDHHTFHYIDEAGGFTARKEHKQRGQWYWVAYRQIHNRLHKVYLGKAETLTEAHLGAASELLAKHADSEG